MPDEPRTATTEKPDTEGGKAPDTAPEPANAWEAMRGAIAEMGEAEPATTEGGERAEPKPKGEPPESRAEPETEPEPEKGEGEEEGKKPEAEAEGEGKEEGGAPPPLQIVGADGSEYELEDWPADAKLKFKADGRPVEATLEEFLTYAQKGVYFDRRSSEWGQRERELRVSAESTQSDLEEAREELDSAWTILRSTILEPDEEKRQANREKVLPHLAKLADPEIRQALEAQARQERDRERTETITPEARQEAIEGFWGGVGEEIAATIRGEVRAAEELEAGLPERPKFEHLSEDDLDIVVTAFHNGYRQHATGLLEKYVAAADRAGGDVEKAAELAEEHALGWLTEANLYGTMQALEGRFAKRFGGERARSREQDGKREAAKHNATVDSQLDRRRRRGVRPGGAPPSGGPSAGVETPNTWEGHMDGMREAFRKAREG